MKQKKKETEKERKKEKKIDRKKERKQAILHIYDSKPLFDVLIYSNEEDMFGKVVTISGGYDHGET